MGDISTEPDTKIIFNAPFDSGASHNLRVTNRSGSKILFKTVVQNAKRCSAEPTLGLLGPNQKSIITCAVTGFDVEEPSPPKEWLSISWVNVGNDVMKAEYRHFQASNLIRHKHIDFEYNI